jgi:hypothetical protein
MKMDLVQRAKNICLSPTTEWPVIETEQTPPATLITQYVVPLAALGAVAGLIGGSLVGRTIPFVGTYRVPITTGVVGAVFALVMAVVGVFVVSLIINALAPTFGASKNSAQALKVAVYSYTPAWIAGVLNILPMLGLLALLAALYGLYLLYLGLPRLMKCPQDRAIGYTAVVVVCAVVVSVVIAAVGAMVLGAGMIGTGMAGASLSRSLSGSDDVQFDKNSPLGKLQSLGNELEKSNKKMEEAAKRGDEQGQMAAAMEGLGTLLGGGKRVDPLAVDQLKPFVPGTFAGLSKTNSNVERTGIAGLMVTTATATYEDGGDKSVSLEISDTGGISGLTGLAGWVGVQGEQDNDDRYERTVKADGRLVHEVRSKHEGGENEFAIVIGDRFVVTAKSNDLDLAGLKNAVGSLDLAKLEAMKAVGVTKD